MTDTPARLLNLLSLLQTPRSWPGSELARRLEVTPRTVRRDVERLRELGYPVQATMGAEGGYRLVAGAAMPPLLLDDEEAVAIAIGLRTVAGQAVAGVDEASVRALAKLEPLLPRRLRRRVGALGAATQQLSLGEVPAVDPEQLSALATAIAGPERVRFAYRAADGTSSTRLVEPHHLVSATRRWYLLGYDNDRNDWRIFRVDRIADLRPTGVRTAPRDLPAADAAAYVTEKMYAMAPTYRAVATLWAPVAEVRRRWGDTPAEVEPVDESRCRLRTDGEALEWLAFRLAMLGCEFEVHEPPELVSYLRDLGTRVTRAAEPTR